MTDIELTAEERAIYEWQMWVPDFGEVGQQKLKNASVMISRVGGVGGVVQNAIILPIARLRLTAQDLETLRLRMRERRGLYSEEEKTHA